MNNRAIPGQGEPAPADLPRGSRRSSLRVVQAVLGLLLALLAPWRAAAAPTTADQARAIVAHWLAQEAAPLGSHLATTIASVTAHANTQGETAYYVVALDPAGFAIVAADDLVEPIVAFSSDGRYDSAPSPTNPIGALVERDLPTRIGRVRGKLALAPGGEESRAQQKWAMLAATPAKGAAQKITTLNDERVSPFIKSQWSQETAPSGGACYNYYTPPYSAGNANNYPCGCVATAMAQVMRYFTYPTVGVGTASFQIKVDRNWKNASLRGGNGSGGAYQWSNMVLKPGSSTTATQCQAIGALTYDAGVAVYMQYATNGSASALWDSADSMVSVFKFAKCGYASLNAGSFTVTTIRAMMNPNLDAGYPLILGIGDTAGNGHAVVCDGYGFNATTAYHHLNMGWGGLDDAWYNLPNIDASLHFTIFDECLYNVHPAETGEIISGRVTNGSGAPQAGVTVTGVGNNIAYSTQTDAHGIYALTNLPSSTPFTLSAALAGMSFPVQAVTTGRSVDYPAMSIGNKWGVDFKGTGTNAARDWRKYE